MTKTINAYVPNQSEMGTTLSAANIAAIAAFTTAEEILLAGVLRKMERTNDPERTTVITKVTGDTSPIVTASDQLSESEKWTLTMIDDYHKGSTGEWGTDSLSAYEIFYELWRANQDPTSITGTPAGSTAGMIETTLTAPTIKSVSEPVIDADSAAPAEFQVFIEVPISTKAVHS